MADPLKNVSTKVTPQSEAARPEQVQNNAGGFVFQISKWDQLDRFLILGTEGGTYYVNERSHTLNNVACVDACIAEDGPRVVSTLLDVSLKGRARKQEPTLFTLAKACSAGDLATRTAGFAAIPQVCRTGTMLFSFCQYIENTRGWGRGLMKAVSQFYTADTARAAYQAVKYRQRDGWTHRDVLRLAHPRTNDAALKTLFDFICGRDANVDEYDALRIVQGFRKVNAPGLAPKEVAGLIAEYNLPWEALADKFMNEAVVWEALLDQNVGLTALIRQLPRLSRLEVLKPMADRTTAIVNRLTNPDELRKARVHPMFILEAMLTYQSGRSVRGSGTWPVVAPIVDALDQAFYASFGAVESTGKRTLLALDVSGSMTAPLSNSPVLSCRVATAALALVTAAVEPAHAFIAFTSGGWQSSQGRKGGYWGSGVTTLNISPRQRLDDVVKTVSGLSFGGTDCALPMLWAAENNIDVDTFVVLTDNETWAGGVHPFQALKNYRAQTQIPAKLAVVGMTSTGFSIADPTDPGMMDFVGFDTATPQALSTFAVM